MLSLVSRTQYYIVFCVSHLKNPHVVLWKEGRKEYVQMYAFCVLGSLQGTTDVQSQLDAPKVKYLELSVRKWKENGVKGYVMSLQPALLDILRSVSFSAAAGRGRRLPETLVSFKWSLKHWPTACGAGNGRTPIDSCGLWISSRMHFNKHQKCNGIPMRRKDEDGNVFIIRFIKDSCRILVRFLRGQLRVCQPDTNKTREGNVKREYLLSFCMFST